MSSTWLTKKIAFWRGLSVREQRVTSLAGAMVLGLLFKLAFIDPLDRSSAEQKAELANKEIQLSDAKRLTETLRIRALGARQAGARPSVKELSAISADLDAKIAALRGSAVNGGLAMTLLERVTQAAGPGLREVGFPDRVKADSRLSSGPASSGELRIHLIMAGEWADYRRALNDVAKASDALNLQRVVFYRGTAGERLMRAEFVASSWDSEWQLPKAALK